MSPEDESAIADLVATVKKDSKEIILDLNFCIIKINVKEQSL